MFLIFLLFLHLLIRVVHKAQGIIDIWVNMTHQCQFCIYLSLFFVTKLFTVAVLVTCILPLALLEPPAFYKIIGGGGATHLPCHIHSR
jgi:hypothetical protein